MSVIALPLFDNRSHRDLVSLLTERLEHKTGLTDSTADHAVNLIPVSYRARRPH